VCKFKKKGSYSTFNQSRLYPTHEMDLNQFSDSQKAILKQVHVFPFQVSTFFKVKINTKFVSEINLMYAIRSIMEYANRKTGSSRFLNFKIKSRSN
jgi:hypothetical protein